MKGYVFESPNQDNVSEGDLLVTFTNSGNRLLKIINTNEFGVVARSGFTMETCSYDKAVVLSKNGKSYVGKSIEKKFFKAYPENGIG